MLLPEQVTHPTKLREKKKQAECVTRVDRADICLKYPQILSVLRVVDSGGVASRDAAAHLVGAQEVHLDPWLRGESCEGRSLNTPEYVYALQSSCKGAHSEELLASFCLLLAALKAVENGEFM